MARIFHLLLLMGCVSCCLHDQLLAVTIEVRVSHDDDDAEEDLSGGGVYINSSDLEIPDSPEGEDMVGVRFDSVPVPAGATITNAYIQFTVDETGSSSTSITIHGEDVGDGGRFNTDDYEVSHRDETTASVNWAPPAWSTVGAAGADQQTPDLSAIVQEIIDRGDWSNGNALVFFFIGSGRRTAESHNGDSSRAPLLHVEYKPPPGTNYYVRTDGSDSNSGLGSSAAQAWRTVNYATRYNNLKGGDIIYVKSGTYTEYIQPDEDGDSGNPIRVVADSSGSVSGWDAGDVILRTNGEMVIDLDNDHYYSFEGFKVQGDPGKESVKLKDSDGIEIHSLEIYDGKDGIHVDGAEVLITNSIMRDQYDHGIRVKGGNADVEALNCVMAHNGIDGVNMEDGVLSVYNSIIAYNTYDGFDDNGGTLIHRYNIVYGNGDLNFEGTSQSTGESTLNPQFVDPSSRDYSLQGTSPAINSGAKQSGIVDKDILGVPRPIGTAWDIGVYEYPLLGHWEFEEGSGVKTADSSGNSQTGLLNGGMTWEAARCGQTVTFDGSNDWIDFGTAELGTLAYTVSVWFKTTARRKQTIFAATAAGTDDHVMFVELDQSGYLYFTHRSPAASSGGTTLVTTEALHDGVWHHVTVVKSTTQLKLFVDGELISAVSDTSSVDSSVDIVMGRAGAGLSQDYFLGSLDEAYLYGAALSDDEVAALSHLLGRWRLDETTGTSAADSSIYQQDGTLRGGLSFNNDSVSPGRIENALNFNGSTDYVDLPDMNYDWSEGLSISLWVNPDSTPGSYKAFLGFSNGTNADEIWLGWNPGSGLEVYLTDTSSGFGSITWNDFQKPQLNVWQHVVITIDSGGAGKIYQEGVETSSRTVDLPRNVNRTRNFLGVSAWADYFDGSLDDVRIYNRALCADEVEAIFSGGKPKGIRIIKWVEIK